MKKIKTLNLCIFTAVMLLIASCGSKAESTPTIDPNEVMTQVVMTVQAEVTQAALLTPSPTATQAPTVTPPQISTQQLPSLPTPVANGGTGFVVVLPTGSPDNAKYVEDITVPDGTVFNKNAKFTKTWRIENNGTTTWNTNYALVYMYGDPILSVDLTTFLYLKNPVAPGNQVDLSITMQAPGTIGTYINGWKMMNENWQFFGEELFVQIVVGTETENTPTPSG